MKILLVSHRYSPDIGGVEEVVSAQSRILADRGHEVRVVTTSKEVEKIGEFKENGVLVNRFSSFSPNNAYFYSRKIEIFLKAIVGEYDIIHAHNYHAFPALHAYRSRGSKPYVLSAHYHGGSHHAIRNMLLKPYKLVSRKMVEGADSVVCVSQSEMQLLKSDFELSNAHVNHNAIELQTDQRDKDKDAICVLGRLEKYKNVDRTIEGIERAIRLNGKGITLHIIGEGPDRPRLERLVENKGLTERVIFHGFLSKEEKDAIIGSCSIMITMSGYESFGITIIEAANQDLRVIASDIPPHRELAGILGEGVSLVDPSNVGTISKTIIETMKKENLPKYEKISEFGWERNVDRLLEIYNKTIFGFQNSI